MPITKTETQDNFLTFEEMKKRLIEIILQGTEDEAYINGEKFLKFYEADINRLPRKQQRKLEMIIEF